MLTAPRRQPGPDSRGFTLVELLVVMMIVAIGFYALRPSFSGAIRGAQRRTALRQLVGLLTSARTKAVAEGRLVRVVLNAGMGSFHAEIQVEPQEDRSAFAPVRLAGRTQVHLPDGIYIVDIGIGGRPGPTDGRTQIYFYPDGRTDGASIALEDAAGQWMVVEIAPATGRVRISA